MKTFVVPAAFLALAAVAASGQAADAKITTPGHSISTDEVRRHFGDPSRTLEAGGDPPITRWACEGYTVCFEHDLVLTSVRHRGP